MPFMTILERKLRAFYVVNPSEKVSYPVGGKAVDTDIACDPLDPSKPNLVFIHAGCRAVAFFSGNFADPRLRSSFNLISVAPRYHGRTVYAGTAEADERTLEYAAGDIMAVLDGLKLEKYCIFAEGLAGCYEAVIIASQRKGKVASMVLASPGRIVETKEVADGLRHLLPLICVNKDGKGDGTGTIPAAVLRENGHYAFGNMMRASFKVDEHNAAFQLRYGTGHDSHDVTKCFLAEVHRKPISAEVRASLDMPILILQGGADKSISPQWAAEEWRDGFVNAKGGCELRVIADAPHLLSYIDSNIVDRIILAFSQNSVTAPPPPPQINRAEIRRSSLAVFANSRSRETSRERKSLNSFVHRVPSFTDVTTPWTKA